MYKFVLLVCIITFILTNNILVKYRLLYETSNLK